MKRILLVIFALVFAQFAWGANTNIQNGESLGVPGVRGKLNVNLDQQYNVKNAPYSATGDGSTNDYAAINSAISDACAAHGGIIYFPPGQYQVNSPIVPCVSAGNEGLLFRGAGRFSSVIKCSMTGYCVDKADTANQYQALVGIEGLGVINSRQNPDAGAIRLEATNTGTYIRDCDVQGYTGISAAADMFTVSISDCSVMGFNAYAPDHVGIYISQGEIHNIKMGAWNTGVAIGSFTQPGGSTGGLISGSPPTHIHNLAIESSANGILVGYVKGPVVTASVSGFTMTVTAFIDGPKFLTNSSMTLNGFTSALPAGTYVTVCPGGNCGATGNYTLNQSGGTLGSQTIFSTTPVSSSTGLTVDSFQTEAVDNPIQIWQASLASFSALALTGTNHGSPQYGGGTVTYSAAAGGTFQFTFPYSFGLTGSNECTTESWTPSGYNFSNQTCDFTGGNVVTITGRGADPGGSGAGGNLSRAMASCIVANNLAQVTFNSVSCSVGHTLRSYAYDFTYFGLFGADNKVTLINVNKGAGFSINATSKAAFSLVNSPEWVLGMHFADLPGQTSVTQPGPYAGQTYYIVDANQATLGGNVTAGGAPNTNGYVTYNGTNWTLTSK